MLVLTFLAGHVADQFDRRQIGLICQVIEAVTMGFIALGIWQGWLPTWGIFAAVTVLGAAQAFERPSMAALLPGIVPTAQLQSAVATSTSVMQTALIIGPALGGILYGFGDVVPFLASGLLFPCRQLQRPEDRKARHASRPRADDRRVGVRRGGVHQE
jgi:MFS family permease